MLLIDGETTTEFLWEGKEEEKKIPSSRVEIASTPISTGGLGEVYDD